MKTSKIPYKHRKFLREYYKINGVGRTVTERYKYWDDLLTAQGGWSISIKMCKSACVRVFEHSELLIAYFPEDFIFC